MSIKMTPGVAELQAVMEKVSKGQRDPKALERLNRGREELRKRVGTLNVAVDLIRDARDQ